MSRHDWDPEKARINAIKHGVTFDEAATVELDPHRWVRLITIGFSIGGLLLYVVTSERGSRPRIISARRATKRERHAYETGS